MWAGATARECDGSDCSYSCGDAGPRSVHHHQYQHLWVVRWDHPHERRYVAVVVVADIDTDSVAVLQGQLLACLGQAGQIAEKRGVGVAIGGPCLAEKRDRFSAAAARREDISQLPPELEKALQLDAAAMAAYHKMAPSLIKQYHHWINSAKRAETRQKRIAEMVEKLQAGTVK